MRTKKTLQQHGLNIREHPDGSETVSYTRCGDVVRYFGMTTAGLFTRAI